MMMSSGQGYIETQNPARLRSLVLENGSYSYGRGEGNANPGERYATFSEVYGPFREDSMELKEETAYQRGMMEHIRENMENISRISALPRGLLSQSSSSIAEPFHADGDMLDTSLPSQLNGSTGNLLGSNNEQNFTGEFWIPVRPNPTYIELTQNRPTSRPPPPPQKSYAEIAKAPKTYSQMWTREAALEREKTVPSLDVTYHRKNSTAHNNNVGISSLPIGWKPNSLSQPAEHWEQRSHGLGKYGRPALGNNRSLDLATSRIPNMLGDYTVPWATERLPALNNSRSLPSLHTVGHGNQGNAANPGRLNIDINLKMVTPRDGNGYGQNGEMVRADFYNSVPQLPVSLPPVPLHSQSSTTVPLQYQPMSIYVRSNQQVRDVTSNVHPTIYPYRQMNNPWFPPLDELPVVPKNMRKGKYGNYRVFDIHDYKRLQKELRLGSLVGQEKEVETLQEKREKRAVLQEYGRLVRAKNREEMRPPLPL